MYTPEKTSQPWNISFKYVFVILELLSLYIMDLVWCFDFFFRLTKKNAKALEDKNSATLQAKCRNEWTRWLNNKFEWSISRVTHKSIEIWHWANPDWENRLEETIRPEVEMDQDGEPNPSVEMEKTRLSESS